jgi:hypothetical protein
MKHKSDEIHRFLDGDAITRHDAQNVDPRELAAYEGALRALERSRPAPPAGFVERVMAVLPECVDVAFRDRILGLWPRDGRWLGPALAGATASLVVIIAVAVLLGVRSSEETLVAFELHAPDAKSVELVGSFNGWAVGEIRLDGPDATGHWTITIPLPEGRHEYLFLVDGRRWITDPKATIRRPDGFGRSNAVLEI